MRTCKCGLPLFYREKICETCKEEKTRNSTVSQERNYNSSSFGFSMSFVSDLEDLESSFNVPDFD